MKIILYLGRIHYIKGLDLLVEAFSWIRGKARLIIAGPDDGYLDELKKLVRRLGLEDDVEFKDAVYGEVKQRLYESADIYVLPSRYESTGITVLEALSYGTPVIVTDRCGLADQLKPPIGDVSPFDCGALANLMLDWLDMPNTEVDKQCRKDFASRFSWARTAEKMENIYREIKARR